MSKPTKISAESVAERAYHLLRRDIIRCELEPGIRVTEVELAGRYSVGRAAVRAALGRLYQAGLVYVLPRRGYVVAPVTIKHVRDLFGVRLLVEPPAARMAAGRLDSHELRRLDELCRVGYRLGDKEAAEALVRANNEFHVTIARASGNDRLAQVIGSLLDEIERLFHLGLMFRDRSDEMYHEHHELIEALLAGDGERAEKVAIDQIVAAQKTVIDALFWSPSLQSVNVGHREPQGTVAAANARLGPKAGPP